MKTLIKVLTVLTLVLSTYPYAADDHSQNHDPQGHGSEEGEHEHEHQHQEESSSRINGEVARQVGIITAIAAPQELHQTVTVYGALMSAPEQLSHVRARFKGLVKSVHFTIGDRVTAGDVLAKIESNESLKIYEIHSPISGRIVQRHANTGEMTQDQVLFSVANIDTVWAELRVYPAHQASFEDGQPVHILTANGGIESKISHIIPSMSSPYQVARVRLDNTTGNLSPGLMVEAHVEVGQIPVSLAVAKDAIQTLDRRQGVFVKQGEEYIFEPLVLGQQDDHFYEVIDGLKSGDEYVSENSYLIKADIEKSEAEHNH